MYLLFDIKIVIYFFFFLLRHGIIMRVNFSFEKMNTILDENEHWLIKPQISTPLPLCHYV